MENPVSRDAQLAAETLARFIDEVPQPLADYITKIVKDEEYSESFDGFLEQWKRENRERILGMYNERYFEVITDPFLYEFKGEKTTNTWDNTICKYIITEIKRLASSFALEKAYRRNPELREEMHPTTVYYKQNHQAGAYYPKLTKDLIDFAFRLNHAYIVAEPGVDDVRPWYQIAFEAAGL
jgi:hypothetical protein